MADWKVKHANHHYSCECCGSYSDAVIEVFKDGAALLRVSSDGHFGGGDFDDYSAGSAVAAVLAKLNPNDHVSLEAVEDE